MRKITKTGLRRKLDKECSRIVRARGECAKCKGIQNLQTAHIFSRRNFAVRWDVTLNLLCLCAGCHFWSHQNPVLFTEFVREYLGPLNYETLRQRATSIKKWSLDEMQLLLQTLTKVI